jgi:hypothetical protein
MEKEAAAEKPIEDWANDYAAWAKGGYKGPAPKSPMERGYNPFADPMMLLGSSMAGGINAAGASRGITATSLRDLSYEDALAGAKAGVHLKQNATTGQYVGAPRGVDNAQKLEAMRDRFDSYAEQGLAGRSWYDKSRAAVSEITGGLLERARLASTELAAWSPHATLEANMGFALNAHNAYEAGVPREVVRTGAQARAYNWARDLGILPVLGRKTGPFAEHIDPSRPSPTTSVNDIWHARAFGYSNKDGSLFDRALTPQEHTFLDAETLLAADRANAKNLGGLNDWRSGNVQASAWVGRKIAQIMADKPKLTFEQAEQQAKSDFSDYLNKHTAAATYEVVPGAATGHLPSLPGAPYETRAAYSLDPRSSWATVSGGRDAIYESLGLYSRPTIHAQGYYLNAAGKPEVNPAFVARPLIDYVPSKAGPVPSGVSNDMLNAGETLRAYFDAQEMGASHRLLDSGKAGQMNAIRVPFDRILNENEMKDLGQATGRFGFHPVDTGQGISLLNFGNGPTPKALPKLIRGELGTAIDSVLQTAGTAKRARQFSNATLQDESGRPLMAAENEGSGKATRALFGAIDNPEILAIAQKLDSPALRQTARDRLQRDAEFAKATGDPVRKDIQNARRIIAKSGLAGLRRALAKGAYLPAVAGLLGLGLSAQDQD